MPENQKTSRYHRILERVKTTLDLPDDSMRAVKIRAAHENRRLKDVVADLLRLGLSQEPAPASRPTHRVQLPLVSCRHPASPEEEVTPDRAAEILLDDEARGGRAR